MSPTPAIRTIGDIPERPSILGAALVPKCPPAPDKVRMPGMRPCPARAFSWGRVNLRSHNDPDYIVLQGVIASAPLIALAGYGTSCRMFHWAVGYPEGPIPDGAVRETD